MLFIIVLEKLRILNILNSCLYEKSGLSGSGV